MSADRYLQNIWYGPASLASLVLAPLSWVFWIAVVVRRTAYRSGLLKSFRVGKPVIVVGNITVGGTGKTPFTIWLAEQLGKRGLRVGIVLRGYGGQSAHWPRHVTSDTSWEEVGDEAVLLAKRTSAIVVAGPDRVLDAQKAIDLGAQVVLCDDGLQHYRLRRDAEILVLDGQRGIGNARMLPAGPLREPRSRVLSADLQVVTRRSSDGSNVPSAFGTSMAVVARSRLGNAVSLTTAQESGLTAFKGRVVHALAAIGHPEAFFNALRECGLQLREHVYPDHAPLTRDQVMFSDDAPVLMTEKDAVKCSSIADDRHWAVPLQIELAAADVAIVSALLDRVLGTTAQGRHNGY
jgi:tetraacyldisaccharide 4'-kinase